MLLAGIAELVTFGASVVASAAGLADRDAFSRVAGYTFAVVPVAVLVALVAAGALRAAADAADGHAPLLDQVRALAERARIPLRSAVAADPATSGTQSPAAAPIPFGLTGRELAVLRLLAAGRTNAQIGAELYISAKTAGVHVTNMLRKLAVSGRVQAAALAERAGLLPSAQP